MFIPEPFRQPYNGDGLQTCGISQKLSKMIVIGLFKLILDQYRRTRTNVFANDVGSERTDFFFLCLQLKFEPERFAKDFEIFRSCEPGRELRRLAIPYRSKVDALKASKR